jgi:DDE superfamily endonuclease
MVFTLPADVEQRPGLHDLRLEGARSKSVYRTDRGDGQSLGAHRPKRIGQLIEGQGCELLYLPAYSPDYNPTEEEAFSKIKNLLYAKPLPGPRRP